MDFLILIIGILAIFVSVVLFSIFGLLKLLNQQISFKAPLYFALCAFISGLTMFAIYPPITEFVIKNNLSMLAVLMMLIISPLFNEYLITFLNSESAKILRLINIVTYVYLVIVLILMPLKILDFTTATSLASHIALIYEVVQAMVIFRNHKTSKNKSFIILFLAMLFVILFDTLEVVNLFIKIVPTFVFNFCSLILFQIAHLLCMVSYIKKRLFAEQKLGETELALLNHKFLLISSQIKPHFIFNVLNSLSTLCMTDPVKAEDAIIKISDYLRHNIRYMEDALDVNITQELLHIKKYFEIEKIRFADNIQLITEINFTDFSLPSFTLQPLVENSVKHGLNNRNDGGIIKIKTEKIENFAVISIFDNGIGFDSSSEYSQSSVGLKNVISRLHRANAIIDIFSVPSEYTNIIIKIPLNLSIGKSMKKKNRGLAMRQNNKL